MAGCQHDAGILHDNELSDIARKRFINDVLNELRFGSSAVKHPFFPINLGLSPQPAFENIPLDDPKAFPDFHKRVLGQYRDLARALDAPSRYTFLPVCCPVSLAVSLGADVPKLKFPDEFITYGFALPLLAIKLGFPMPADLAAKLPSLLGVPIPDLKLPEIDFDPKVLPDLLSFNSALLGVPPKLITAALELLTRMPQLALGVLTLDLSVFFDVIAGSKMFGDFNPSSALVWLVAQKVLAIRTAECILIYVVGTTMGSSAGGIVGGLSTLLGYVPPPGPKNSTNDPRKRVLNAADISRGQSLSNDKAGLPVKPAKYAGFLLPQEIDDGTLDKTNKAIAMLEHQPAGQLYARALCLRGGASSDFFTKRLQTLDDLSTKLENEVKSIDAHQVTNVTTFNPKVGDIIVSDVVSLVVTSKASNGLNVINAVMGGKIDIDGEQTAIGDVELQITNNEQQVVLFDGTSKYIVKYVIDVTKLAG